MGFNPLKNKVALSSQTTLILTIILYLLGYEHASIIVLILGVVWTGGFYFINDLKKRSRISREKEFQKYVKRTGDSFLDHFDDPLRDGLAMYCFSYMEKPYYYNVIKLFN